ncbi:protein kinase [Cryptosporidium canis]|uniref:Protein kinase n=1 Tax=Cryptosporidium canis TaxID=195482 RepID=A0ABQ8P752_9CRYT|nr:protein kinase [Cryptosporidium canis]KAJ1614427.1 protein kinase [Cryptosporidium canis]
MNNELTATIGNILKIHDINNDDLALMLSMYIQQNFSKNTSPDIFTDKNFYIQEKIIRVSIAIVTNCNLIAKARSFRYEPLNSNKECPIIKNYIEFDNIKDLNDWIIGFYNGIFSKSTHLRDEHDIEKKIQLVLDELDEREILPFKSPPDLFKSIYVTGTVSPETIAYYLESLRLTCTNGEPTFPRIPGIKNDTFLCKNFNIDQSEQSQHCKILDLDDSSGNKILSFSQKVEKELHRLDNYCDKHEVTEFMVRISVHNGLDEHIETRIKTLEEIVKIYANANTSSTGDIHTSEDGPSYSNFLNKNRFIHLLRQNINSLSVLNRFLIIKVLHKGNFGDVYAGIDLISFKLVCLKKLIGNISDIKYLKNSTIEANYLKILSRSVISEFVPYFIDVAASNSHVFIISELQGKNLLSVMKTDYERAFLTFDKIQRIIRQLLICVRHLHETFKLIHCDIKPENIVVNCINAHDIFGYLNNTQFDKNNDISIKLVDWGSCISISQALSKRNLYIQSRYYRSPEVCLGLPCNEKIDIWSIGCVMAELVLRRPLFDFSSSSQQLLANIITIIGKLPMQMVQKSSTIDHFITHDGHLFDRNLSKIRLFTTFHNSKCKGGIAELFDAEENPLFVDLLSKLLCIDPDKRISATQALNHPWFDLDYKNT